LDSSSIMAAASSSLPSYRCQGNLAAIWSLSLTLTAIMTRWRASRCMLCLSCRRALCTLLALLITTARLFRIVGKLRGNLFTANQSRAASHAPLHFTLLAPRTSHFTLTSCAIHCKCKFWNFLLIIKFENVS